MTIELLNFEKGIPLDPRLPVETFLRMIKNQYDHQSFLLSEGEYPNLIPGHLLTVYQNGRCKIITPEQQIIYMPEHIHELAIFHYHPGKTYPLLTHLLYHKPPFKLVPPSPVKL